MIRSDGLESDWPRKQTPHTILEAKTDSRMQPNIIHRTCRDPLQPTLSHTYFIAKLVRHVNPSTILDDSLCVYPAALTSTSGAQQHIPTIPEELEMIIVLEEL